MNAVKIANHRIECWWPAGRSQTRPEVQDRARLMVRMAITYVV